MPQQACPKIDAHSLVWGYTHCDCNVSKMPLAVCTLTALRSVRTMTDPCQPWGVVTQQQPQHLSALVSRGDTAAAAAALHPSGAEETQQQQQLNTASYDVLSDHQTACLLPSSNSNNELLTWPIVGCRCVRDSQLLGASDASSCWPAWRSCDISTLATNDKFAAAVPSCEMHLTQWLF